VLHEASGEVYNIGSRAEKTNLEIVNALLELLRQAALTDQVRDRPPGYDRRYGNDPTKIETGTRLAARGNFRERNRKDRPLVYRQQRVDCPHTIRRLPSVLPENVRRKMNVQMPDQIGTWTSNNLSPNDLR